ncbi:photoreceptor outer segment membrane glycoprotein 2-like, partial [Centruroides sculpturatus]|uniref:photoreceptor outer segment membrane glycoprotein 2-like n=1 Tax=Centruroides sculpturatus TaxID=218467 RepID=UPI000C6CA498
MRILFTESERRIIGFCLLFLHIIMCFVYSVILLNRHNQIEYVEMNSLIGLNLENTEIFATILTHISIILHISGALISSNYSNAWNRWIFLNYFGYWILFYLMFFMSEVVFLLILISHFWELKPPWEFDIIPSMKKYRLSEDIKVMLDKLQINLKCCGGKGIGDWMDIAWIPRQVIIQRTGIENKLTAEWVPESCCNLTFDGPCYPKFVFKERKGITYYDTIEMFNSKGCNDVLPQYLLLLTKKIIWFIVVIMTTKSIRERIEYTPSSGQQILFPEAQLELCDAPCTPEKLTTKVTLSTHHIGKGCDRDTYSVDSQRKLCGASSDSIDLLPSPGIGAEWTRELPTDEGHESDQIYEFDGVTNAVVIPESTLNHNLTNNFTVAFWMKHEPLPDHNNSHMKEHIICNADDHKMNRHHYAIFVRNCRLILLLRREFYQKRPIVFRPAEWRWKTIEVCDNQWHHYAISVNFPEDGPFNKCRIKNTEPLSWDQSRNHILLVVAYDCGMKRSKPTTVNIKVHRVCRPGWK